jgi:hypothetical protein
MHGSEQSNPTFHMQHQSVYGTDELSESDGDSSAGPDSDTSSTASSSSQKEASKARLAAKAAGVSKGATVLGDAETRKLIARIKGLKSKVLSEEKAATTLDIELAKKVASLKGLLTTAKDDREAGDSMEDQAKKVQVQEFLTYSPDAKCSP